MPGITLDYAEGVLHSHHQPDLGFTADTEVQAAVNSIVAALRVRILIIHFLTQILPATS
jgi:hypothetical protein